MSLVVGLDPSNERTGVSYWEDGRLLVSGSYDPWNSCPILGVWVNDPQNIKPTHVFVEVPQNGTYKSRGGVHWAAGMAVGFLRSVYPIKRRRVHKIKPRTWRQALGLGLTEGKDYYIAKAGELCGTNPKDHDQAEAELVGLYGVKVLAGEIER